jgi:hypothetical protein
VVVAVAVVVVVVVADHEADREVDEEKDERCREHDPHEKQEKMSRFVSFVFTLVSSLFILIGISVVAFAIWAAVGKSRTGVTLAVTTDAAFALLGIGALISLVSFMGCMGTIKKSKGLLVAYSVTVLLLMIGEAVLVALSFTGNSAQAVSSLWTQMSNSDRCEIQTAFKCTGFATPADRPGTMCGTGATGVACSKAFARAVDSNMHTVMGSLIGIGVFQLLLFFAAVYLACKASKAAAAAPKYTRLVANDEP